MSAGALIESVAFDQPVQTAGAGGVVTTVWTEKHVARAQFIYRSGSEVIEAARLEGRAIYKLRIRQCALARQITTDWRMRDSRRSEAYAITEVDAITDRAWVYVVVESGRAA